MINPETIKLIAYAKQRAEDGVAYSRRLGAVCPMCGESRTYTIRSLPWTDGVKIRYHRCKNPNCLLCALQTTIKSVEEE